MKTLRMNLDQPILQGKNNDIKLEFSDEQHISVEFFPVRMSNPAGQQIVNKTKYNMSNYGALRSDLVALENNCSTRVDLFKVITSASSFTD
jgi:hypothetical protein